jgi:hypothetical protein
MKSVLEGLVIGPLIGFIWVKPQDEARMTRVINRIDP